MKNIATPKNILIAFAAVLLGMFALTYLQDSNFVPETANSEKTEPKEEEEEVHYHAGFQVYDANGQLDFSGFDYMNVNPCGDDGTHDDEEEHTEEDYIHLHDLVGDIVHIHGPGQTWGMVFEHLELSPEGEVVAYNNTERVENPLNTPVEPYQSMIFLLDENASIDPTDQSNYLTKDYIIEVEEKGENCSK